MPLDRFFTSNFDTNELLDWIQEIREGLIGLNRLNANNPNSVFNAETARLFLENSTRTYALYALSKYEQDKDNNKAKERVKEMADISKAYQDLTLDENSKIKDLNLLETSQEYVKIRDENKLIEKDPTIQQYRSNNQFNNYTPDPSSIDPVFRTESPFTTLGDDGNQVTTSNEDVFQDLNKSITDNLNEVTEFTPRTGYKRKGDNVDKIFKSWVKIGTDGSKNVDENNTFTPLSPYTKKIDTIIQNMKVEDQVNAFQGSYKFFIEKLHGRTSTGPYKKNQIKSNKVKGLDNIPDELSNRMVFAAYIDNFYDDYQVSWNDYTFIGRGEKVPVYKNTTRSLTLVFDIISDHSTEYMLALEELQNQTKQREIGLSEELLQRILESSTDWGLGYQGGIVTHTNTAGRIGAHIPGIISDTPEGLWTKMTFLAQCAYPYYRIDGKMKEQPMVRLRIADFYDVTGTIESISIELNEAESVQIDLNPSSLGNIPLYAKVNLKLTIYHDFEPSSNFYGFYHRKEFDSNEIDKVTGVQLKAKPVKKSPTSFLPTDVKDDMLKMPAGFESYFTNLQSDLKNFNTNFTDLKSSGLKLKDALFKEKFKNSIQSYNKVKAVAKEIQQMRGDETLITTDSDTVIPDPKKGLYNSTPKILDAAKEFKNNIDVVYGNIQSVIQGTKNQLQKTNELLNRVGVNLGNVGKVDDLAKKAENTTPFTFTPKTFKDILGKLNKV